MSERVKEAAKAIDPDRARRFLRARGYRLECEGAWGDLWHRQPSGRAPLVAVPAARRLNAAEWMVEFVRDLAEAEGVKPAEALDMVTVWKEP